MERTILATLAYADAQGTPLTAVQVHQRLVAPERVHEYATPSLGDVTALLDRLRKQGDIHETNGWYTLSEPADGMFVRRMAQANISADKWKKMLRKANRLQWIPFIYGIAASGSLAAGTTSERSDWDMFVIAKHGRLYTARIFLLLACRFMGVLRTKSEQVAPDKFCFNHYVTDEGLAIRHRSLFVAHALTGLVPIVEREGVFQHLRKKNAWIREYLANPAERIYPSRQVRPSVTLVLIRSTFELLLSWTVGDGLETVLRWWQQRRIKRDPATHARGGRVIADDQELEFHPRSAERAVLLRYNELLPALGINAPEQDSGLTA